MASRRQSGRRKKGSGFARIAIGAVVLVAAGVGGFLLFGGKSGDATESGIADLIPGLDTTGSHNDAAATAQTQSLAQVQRLLSEISAGLAVSNGDVREEALRDGYKRLSTLLENPLPIEEREQTIELFHTITDELFLSPAHNEFCENYLVKSGDSFDRIALRHGISINLLWDLNKIPRGHKTLHPGDNLKVPKAAPRMVIRKSDFTTSLYFGDNLVRQYIIAHGKNDNTPVGSTSITSMTIDPEKQARGPNDVRAEMKLRWIGWGTYASGRSGFGFHGTQNPDSIPGMSSRGCIRMRDHDVVELYDIVREGNKIDVRA